MLIFNLKKVYRENSDKRYLYIRSLLKEVIQYYVLNFVYTSKWGKMLLFKGGTALRFCYKLPRLSEDLDFDIEDGYSIGIEAENDFKIDIFTKDLINYFNSQLKFDKLDTKIANNKRTLYLKLPILKDLGFQIGSVETNILHVRLDFSQNKEIIKNTGVSAINYENLSFSIRRYQIEDLFAGKLSAILTREKMEGREKVERFKGRDYFDLIWYLEKGVKPNWDEVIKMTSFTKTKAIEVLDKKVKEVKKSDIEDDLIPFLEDENLIKSFADNFKALVSEYIKNLI